RTHHVGGVEDVAELVAGEAVEAGGAGGGPRAQGRAGGLVPGGGGGGPFAAGGPGRRPSMGAGGALPPARGGGRAGWGGGVGWGRCDLLHNVVGQMRSSEAPPNDVIEGQRVDACDQQGSQYRVLQECHPQCEIGSSVRSDYGYGCSLVGRTTDVSPANNPFLA